MNLHQVPVYILQIQSQVQNQHYDKSSSFIVGINENLLSMNLNQVPVDITSDTITNTKPTL